MEAEIDILRELGVKFKTGVEVEKDITLDELRAEGYEAFTWQSERRKVEARY